MLSGGYNYEELLDGILEGLFSEPFFTSRMKMSSKTDGFLIYYKLGVEIFSLSEVLYANMEIRLQLITVRPTFFLISDNPNVSLGIVEHSLYTRRVALKDDYHRKRMDMLAYTSVEINYLETPAKTFIIPAREKQFIQKIFLTLLQFVGLLLQ